MPTIPSGATRPFVWAVAVAGTIGSEVRTDPAEQLSAAFPGPVVQFSILVVGLAFDWAQ